jgi:hypothetical protein
MTQNRVEPPNLQNQNAVLNAFANTPGMGAPPAPAAAAAAANKYVNQHFKLNSIKQRGAEESLNANASHSVTARGDSKTYYSSAQARPAADISK